MELDEVKKTWNEMDALKEKLKISDDRIKELLKKDGKSALSRLIRTSKIGVIALIPTGLLLCLFSYNFFIAGGYYMICPLAFLLICILAEPIEIYGYRMMKSINFSDMSVKEVSERILKYQHFVHQCQLYGMIGACIYMGIWGYLSYTLSFGSEIIWGFIIYIIILYLATLIAIPFAYKKLFYKHINRIKESLQELKEFDNL